jgi:hypothetical protein
MENSDAKEWLYQIQTCRISSDMSFIAIQTLYYNIITVNTTTGDVLKSYFHTSINSPSYFMTSQFLFPTATSIYTGYNDDTYQWRIVKIPVLYSSLSDITTTRSN